MTMAMTNIVTDILLILYPLPLILRMTLTKSKKLELAAIFGVGIFVIGVTIARLPLIFDKADRQFARSVVRGSNLGNVIMD